MGESGANLTQAEIQAGIDKANEQRLEAIECKYSLKMLTWTMLSCYPQGPHTWLLTLALAHLRSEGYNS